ncbi:MAG: hypothetical protein ACLPXT_11930 [Terracidiphilus sp.]
MTGSAHPLGQWVPASEAERNLVLKELESMLASYHFQSSKRYPAMLRYIVDATLDGRSGDLKERTLGVEVFGRDPDYDTSADPVVRLSAGEVRKRIAQYYHENGGGPQVQIELPLGSYVPEFLLREPETPEAQPEPVIERPPSTGNHILAGRHRLVIGILSATVLVTALVAGGIYAYNKASAARDAVIDNFWGPMVKPVERVLIVVGTGNRANQLNPEDETTSFGNHISGPTHRISLASATALANVAGVLHQHGVTQEIKEDKETSLTDIHSHRLILIGATNNPWTMRLVNSLRFRFLPGPMAQIQDTKNLQNTDWSIDFSKPNSSVSTDYAIVARYYDPTTEGPVMVIAGIGPYGTEAASAFAVTPQYLEQIAKQLPAGWENRNLEMVLKTEVIDGKAGPPLLVSSEVW